MITIAVSTLVAVFALIGLAIGLVVFLAVASLLNGVLAPLRQILNHVRDAQTAPMLEHGVKGPEQLGRTRQLAEAVPNLAVAYMQKLGLPVNTEAATRTFPEPGSSSSRQGGVR
jgi:ABC-type lipoprotein release transport system permease subunit